MGDQRALCACRRAGAPAHLLGIPRLLTPSCCARQNWPGSRDLAGRSMFGRRRSLAQPFATRPSSAHRPVQLRAGPPPGAGGLDDFGLPARCKAAEPAHPIIPDRAGRRSPTAPERYGRRTVDHETGVNRRSTIDVGLQRSTLAAMPPWDSGEFGERTPSSAGIASPRTSHAAATSRPTPLRSYRQR